MALAVILPTAYFGSISYFTHFHAQESVRISTNEKYQKQTFRNRTTIVNSNGKLQLSVPVSRPNGAESLTSEVRISYAENWKKDHLKSLEAAYARSPYYEFYIDEISAVLRYDFELLVDLNFALTDLLLGKLNLETEIIPDPIPPTEIDLNNVSIPRYIQSFEERHGFQPNLSILDLLFHEGPNSETILSKCILDNE